jgi:hypothetical protein
MASADERGDLFNAFLDELVGGNDAPDHPLDPARAEAARSFFAHDDAPPPPAGLAAQIWESVMNQATASNAPPISSSVVVLPAHNGRTQPRSWRSSVPPGMETQTHRRWGFGQVVTAVFVVFVLGLVIFVLGPGRSNDGQPATVPAGVPTVTPTPNGPSEEMLLTVTFPTEALPRGKTIGTGITEAVILPGTRSTWQQHCCPGPVVDYVVEGAYTVRAEATIQVVRADGTIEEVPANTEITLGPGDAVVSRNEIDFEAANNGTTPVTLLNWVLIDDPGNFSGRLFPGWQQRGYDVLPALLSSIPERPATVRFKRVTVPAKTELPLPPPGTYQFRRSLPEPNAAGTPVVRETALRTNGAIYNRYDQAIDVYIVTLEFAPDPRQFSAVVETLSP